ncbi:MAG: hypothetical protein ACI4P4_08420 [Faecousia sp.]
MYQPDAPDATQKVKREKSLLKSAKNSSCLPKQAGAIEETNSFYSRQSEEIEEIVCF